MKTKLQNLTHTTHWGRKPNGYFIKPNRWGGKPSRYFPKPNRWWREPNRYFYAPNDWVFTPNDLGRTPNHWVFAPFRQKRAIFAKIPGSSRPASPFSPFWGRTGSLAAGTSLDEYRR
jgi:hypothetical protein